VSRTNNSRRVGAGVASFALAAGLYGAGLAAAEAADLVSDEWQFQVTPYLWALSIDGNVTVRGFNSSQSVTFSDILSDLNFALMVEGEARKDRIGVYANVIYSDLSDTDNTGSIRIRSNAETVWAGAGAYYRLGPWPLLPDAGPSGPVVVVDPYAGARYTYLNAEIKIRDGGPQVEQDKNWVDPVVGLRTIWLLTPKWSVTALGDIGGFSVGSNFSWQAAGMVGYRFGLFGDDNARFLAGYRALYQDYKSGNGRNEFKWDVTVHGPMLALAIDF
jgi:hypothetical protein